MTESKAVRIQPVDEEGYPFNDCTDGNTAVHISKVLAWRLARPLPDLEDIK